MTTQVKKLLSKFESAPKDVFYMEVPLKDINALGDTYSVPQMLKVINQFKELNGYKVSNLDTTIDGNKDKFIIQFDLNKSGADKATIKSKLMKMFKE